MKTIKIIMAAFVAMVFINSSFAQGDNDSLVADIGAKYKIEYDGFSPTMQERVTDAPDQTGFHIGVRYQPIFGSLGIEGHGGKAVTARMQASHGFALSLNYYFNNWIGSHLEMMWAQQTYAHDDAEVTLSYLTFPVMASLNTNFGKRINLNIAAGPYLGFNIGADADVRTTGDDETTATAVANVNPLDVGVAYGGGVDFGFGPENGIKLRVGYRGTTGLLDLQDSGFEAQDNQVTVIAAGSRMQTHGFYLGLMFKL
jgi:hypothetical protein